MYNEVVNMKNPKKKLLRDFLFTIFSISVAVFLIRSGLIYEFIFSLDGLLWLGIIFAGLFFTSIFTTAPAIALLGSFAQTTPLLILAILGGLGAMIGDLIIFTFVRGKVSKGFDNLLKSPQGLRFSVIFKHEIFRFFLPFFGAIVIASPLPDEVGVAMLGISKMSKKRFLILSFTLNSVGIFIVSWLAKIIIG